MSRWDNEKAFWFVVTICLIVGMGSCTVRNVYMDWRSDCAKPEGRGEGR